MTLGHSHLLLLGQAVGIAFAWLWVCVEVLKSTDCCSTSPVPSQQLPGIPWCPPGREFPLGSRGLGAAGIWGQPMEMFLIQPCKAQARAAQGLLLWLCSALQDFRLFFWHLRKWQRLARLGMLRQLSLRQTLGLLLDKHHFLLATKGSSHTEPHGGRVTFTRGALSFFFC